VLWHIPLFKPTVLVFGLLILFKEKIMYFIIAAFFMLMLLGFTTTALTNAYAQNISKKLRDLFYFFGFTQAIIGLIFLMSSLDNINAVAQFLGLSLL
jgi:hypothetical protein